MEVRLVVDYSKSSFDLPSGGGLPAGCYSFWQANHGRGPVWDRTPATSARFNLTTHSGFDAGGIVVDWEYGMPSLGAWRALLSRYSGWSAVIAHGINTGTSRSPERQWKSLFSELLEVLRENAASFSLDLYRVPGEDDRSWEGRREWRKSFLRWVQVNTGIMSYQFVTPHDYGKPDPHGTGAVVPVFELERIAETIDPTMGVAIHASASRADALPSLDAAVGVLAAKLRKRLGIDAGKSPA